MTSLFFVIYTDDDGINMDLFVEASSGAEALRLWQDYFQTDEMPMRIDAVPSLTGVPRAISWYSLVTG